MMTNSTPGQRIKLIFVLTAAVVVYLGAHWNAVKSPYVINDDVRQQIYWMEKWRDPTLFQNDILTDHAVEYVPSGVRAIYHTAAFFFSPVQFSKILTGFVFVITAGLIFGLGREFGDEYTGLLSVFFFFFFAHFLARMSGGLSRGFVYPLLVAYMLFLARGNSVKAGIVLMIQPVFNPYIFLLCMTTHLIYFFMKAGNFFFNQENSPHSRQLSRLPLQETHPHAYLSHTTTTGNPKIFMLLVAGVPVVGGLVLIASAYIFADSFGLGDMVTREDMIGQSEYGPLGRFQILPTPSFISDLIWLWGINLPFKEWGPYAGGASAIILLSIAVAALRKKNTAFFREGFRVLCCLLAASVLLYVLSRVFILKFFIPKRYIEFSFNVFFCIGTAGCLRTLIHKSITHRTALILLAVLIVPLCTLRLKDVGLYDYSEHSHLYTFINSMPKDVLIAGHPEIMDNIVTFSKRKAFVTYELSHTWIKPYWTVIKARTFDLFDAYYSEEPETIIRFCRRNKIDFLVVRNNDFTIERFDRDDIYFEPFNTYIRKKIRPKARFAVLDEKVFPPLYHVNGIRVLRVN